MALLDRNDSFITATHKDCTDLDHPFKKRITGFKSKKLPLLLMDALKITCAHLNHDYLTLQTAGPSLGAGELLL